MQSLLKFATMAHVDHEQGRGDRLGHTDEIPLTLTRASGEFLDRWTRPIHE